MNTDKLGKQIVVDANPFRARVALIENGRVEEMHIELRSKEGIMGNIYKGRVQRVLPGMAAAFIDIGIGRNVFLGLSDMLDPSAINGADWENSENTGVNTDDRFDAVQNEIHRKKPEKLPIKDGQTVMVQIIKEAFGTKSERASMQISLPGHTLVFMPEDNFVGISKRITDEEERKRLKNIALECCPEGTGTIMRTAASECDEETIRKELSSLVAKWNRIRSAYTTAKTPSLIYHEESLAARMVRDLLKTDVQRLIVNDRALYEELMDITRETEPEICERIELRENEYDLFEILGIENQINAALARKVWLKSGAYLVIDQTEAFVTIDVNTGKKVGKTDIEKTIVETNVEAAAEIAHQMRLRNLSGMIIIDFIDMVDKKDREAVITALKEAVKPDRIHSVIIDMTDLGLVVVTRKKTRTNLSSSLQTECPYCGGTGKVVSAETVALRLRENILSRCCNYGIENMTVTANPKVLELAESYFSTERETNARLSEALITWKADPHKHIGEFAIKNNM